LVEGAAGLSLKGRRQQQGSAGKRNEFAMKKKHGRVL
jgi:hypothetical protein